MKLLSTFILLTSICVSCNSDYPYIIKETRTTDTIQYPVVEYTNNISFKEDTAFYGIIKDCQFNCYVMDIYKENDSVTAYVTECGLYFYSDIPYSIGDSLFKFSSPKHN